MKRDEALLKKAIDEAGKLKKQMQNMKPKVEVQEKVIVQPMAIAGVKGRATAKAGE